MDVNSVIVLGRMEMIDDIELVSDISARLSRKFIQDEEHIAEEIRTSANATLLLKLVPEHICGKAVQES